MWNGTSAWNSNVSHLWHADTTGNNSRLAHLQRFTIFSILKHTTDLWFPCLSLTTAHFTLKRTRRNHARLTCLSPSIAVPVSLCTTTLILQSTSRASPSLSGITSPSELSSTCSRRHDHRLYHPGTPGDGWRDWPHLLHSSVPSRATPYTGHGYYSDFPNGTGASNSNRECSSDRNCPSYCQ